MTTLGNLGQFFDGPHATPQRRTEGPYFLNISSLGNGRLDLSRSDHVSEEDFVRWTRRVTPQSGDLLFSYETRLGEAALMPDGVRACLGRRMGLIRPDRSVVDPHFLLYFYLSPQFQNEIARRAIHGATVSRISLASMPTWQVSIPDLHSQCAIGAVLGALDDKIAANEVVRLVALSLAWAAFLQEIQEADVEPLTLGELCDRGWLQLGDGYRTKRTEHGRPGLRILRAGDVQVNLLRPSGEDFVSAEFRRMIGIKASEPGDIVMTTKGTVGRVAVVPAGMEQVVYSPQLCYFRVIDRYSLSPGFLSAWFRSDDLQSQAASRMFKSDMAPYINLQDIRSMTVPMVPSAEQHRIGDVQLALEGAMHGVQRENAALAALRDELLPLLMSGKIRVRDAEKRVEEVV